MEFGLGPRAVCCANAVPFKLSFDQPQRTGHRAYRKLVH